FKKAPLVFDRLMDICYIIRMKNGNVQTLQPDAPGVAELVKIFRKTFEDKRFTRSEKKAVTQLLTQDYRLDKDQRDVVRSKLFEMAYLKIRGPMSREILDWLETANKLLLNPQDSHAYFSPGGDCLDCIISQLDQAALSVDICVYTISDDRISRAISACHKRKVDVRIITDDDKISDRGSDIWELAAYGIKTKIDNSRHYMHHKFAVFDNQRVMTGSYNWTRSAAEYNQENLLLTNDKRVVESYKAEFQRLWDTMEFLNLPGKNL
ncbi:MAG: DUF1669 domain-containing protein, partial [bacterium]|nr:DUF1669 domain-containing protein [bacterium]